MRGTPQHNLDSGGSIALGYGLVASLGEAMIDNPVFRWIAVAPAALLAAAAAMFPWHLVVLIYANYVGYFEGNETLGLGALVRVVGPENVERLGYGFISPFVIIVVAAKVAPRYRVTTGRVAATLVAAGLIFIGLFVPQYELVGYFQDASGWDKLYPVVLFALWVSGIYAALRFNDNRSTD